MEPMTPPRGAFSPQGSRRGAGDAAMSPSRGALSPQGSRRGAGSPQGPREPQPRLQSWNDEFALRAAREQADAEAANARAAADESARAAREQADAEAGLIVVLLQLPN